MKCLSGILCELQNITVDVFKSKLKVNQLLVIICYLFLFLPYYLDVTCYMNASYHTVYLWLASLCQVYDVDAVVVEIFHAALEVLSEEGSRFTWQRDASKAQLR